MGMGFEYWEVEFGKNWAGKWDWYPPFRSLLQKSKSHHFGIYVTVTRGLVSKEIVVLRRWRRETQKFGFIN